jgi:hypothetical protein
LTADAVTDHPILLTTVAQGNSIQVGGASLGLVSANPSIAELPLLPAPAISVLGKVATLFVPSSEAKQEAEADEQNGEQGTPQAKKRGRPPIKAPPKASESKKEALPSTAQGQNKPKPQSATVLPKEIEDLKYTQRRIEPESGLRKRKPTNFLIHEEERLPKRRSDTVLPTQKEEEPPPQKRKRTPTKMPGYSVDGFDYGPEKPPPPKTPAKPKGKQTKKPFKKKEESDEEDYEDDDYDDEFSFEASDSDDTPVMDKTNKRETSLCGAIVAALDELEDYQDDEGYALSSLFSDLPKKGDFASKQEFLTYQKMIPNQISLKMMQQKASRNVYVSEQEFMDDFTLMINNAKTYNQKGSVAYGDAKLLKRTFMKMWEEEYKPHIKTP